METIDGLTYENVKYNVYAFAKDMRLFARKRDRARTEHMKAKWQRKYANAKGYLENNQERLARFKAFQQGVQPTVATAAPPEVESTTRNSG